MGARCRSRTCTTCGRSPRSGRRRRRAMSRGRWSSTRSVRVDGGGLVRERDFELRQGPVVTVGLTAPSRPSSRRSAGGRCWGAASATTRRGRSCSDVRVRLTMPGLAEPAEAVVTPSGVFAWRSLPGLGRLGAGDNEDGAGAASRRPLVTVDDPQGRYLAYRFTVTLPLRGTRRRPRAAARPVRWAPASSPGRARPAGDVPCRCSRCPGRPPPTAMAVVEGGPAPPRTAAPRRTRRSRLTADTGETHAASPTSAARSSVFLPYPKVARSRGSVPASAPVRPPGRPLTQMQWELDVSGGRAPTPRRGGAGPVRPDRPGPAARLSDGRGHRARALGSLTLTYGRELVLRCADGPRRELLVGP